MPHPRKWRRLKEENEALKRAVAETVLDNQRLKKKFGPVKRRRYQRMAAEYKLEVLRAVEGSVVPH